MIGTASWSIPRPAAHLFPGDATHLRRYAQVLPCVEINSSFYRPHAAATYARWAASTPPDFQFSVKVPRVITHELELRRARVPLERFLEETAGLGDRRGPLLIQLPPSQAFDSRVVSRFFDLLRDRHSGPVVCEPRHETWFTMEVEALLVRYRVARVAADPPPAPGAERPAAWPETVYFRLHGSPRKYWSRYGAEFLDSLVPELFTSSSLADAWCVFDNTASGSAIRNALEMRDRIANPPV